MLKTLHFAKFNFTAHARDTILLPPYKGSTFRGGFGNTFKRVVCIRSNKDCDTCLLRDRCIYLYIFETPPPAETAVMRKYETAPHPFVIEPFEDTRTTFEPGESLSFGLVLIGKAIDHLPYFIYTFEELGNSGIGKGRGRYILEDVSVAKETPVSLWFTKGLESPLPLKGRERVGMGLFSDETAESVYSATDKKLRGSIQPQRIPEHHGWNGRLITLSFLTPTRIVYEEHLTEKPEFHILIRSLLRRIAHLSYFHCGGDSSQFDFKGMIDRAMKVILKEENLKWYDWERYSARQDTRMKLGGFVGDITFEGDLGEFIPYIKAGEVVHIGKGTSFGLGKYSIQCRE